MPSCGFTTFFSIVAVQAVQASARMGVHKLNARVFVHQMLQSGNQSEVFEDVGVVSGVKSVAITEHKQDGNPPFRPCLGKFALSA